MDTKADLREHYQTEPFHRNLRYRPEDGGVQQYVRYRIKLHTDIRHLNLCISLSISVSMSNFSVKLLGQNRSWGTWWYKLCEHVHFYVYLHDHEHGYLQDPWTCTWKGKNMLTSTSWCKSTFTWNEHEHKYKSTRKCTCVNVHKSTRKWTCVNEHEHVHVQVHVHVHRHEGKQEHGHNAEHWAWSLVLNQNLSLRYVKLLYRIKMFCTILENVVPRNVLLWFIKFDIPY